MHENTTNAHPKKLLDQVRDKIRFKHYSLSTENTYLSWIKQFIRAPREATSGRYGRGRCGNVLNFILPRSGM